MDHGRELIHTIARELSAMAPAGWQRLDAVFAITLAAEVAHVVFVDAEHAVSMQPPESVLALVRAHRQVAATMSAGPWWQLLLGVTASGELVVDYDYGDEPFPDGQLFAPEVYRHDLEAFPHTAVPMWLAAYVGHNGRQQRTPPQAVARARADRAAEVWPRLVGNEFPPFPLMWARWATLAAAFTAVRSAVGPRMMPWLAIFEGAARSGATLHPLPGGRAVLSGGVWNAPELATAYRLGGPFPELYAGAPEWVAGPVLNPRAANGLLSFCYWWEAGHWYRGESPSADDCAQAVPGMWTSGTTTDMVVSLAAVEPDERVRTAAAELVSAAEGRVVTRDTLVAVFGDGEQVDIDGAFYQFVLAGLAVVVARRMPENEVTSRVRDYIRGLGPDGLGIPTADYPLSKLTAKRFDVGWVLYVPVSEGRIVMDWPVFYLTDDGVLEHSSSVASAQRMAELGQQFRQRHGSGIDGRGSP
ncbi:hypothetical protein OHB12_12480 [Nocardia sp. NBC_01730]|uniref:hypothetical protein n=1 Tax=Nocardia sp. NBC_01730 TaxID=2975998 RepID=UPI002E115693|nr:hypothetical protein OHB12_12480 [Nocardia sp. NBC_01730]